MDKYAVKFNARAYRDLDGIFSYIAENLSAPETATNIIDEIEKAIYSLEHMPERGAIRKIEAFTSREYRQIFVKNYVIIYRVNKNSKEVFIVTVRYAQSNF